jgi:hypothetical protein
VAHATNKTLNVLSTPATKAVYGKEPSLADLKNSQFTQREKDLRLSMVKRLVQMLCKQSDKPSDEGIEWCKSVFCRDSATFEATAIATEAAAKFPAWDMEYRKIVQDAWIWRKAQIASAFAAEKDTRAFELKGSNKQMQNRQQVKIPE